MSIVQSSATEQTPTLAEALAGLPAKLRVHELAKRAGLSSKETLARLAEQGVSAGSAASSVLAEHAIALLTAVFGASVPEPAATESADGAAAVAVQPEQPSEPAPKQRAPRRSRAKAAQQPEAAAPEPVASSQPVADSSAEPAGLFLEPAPARPTRSRRRKTAEPVVPEPAVTAEPAGPAQAEPSAAPQAAEGASRSRRRQAATAERTAADETAKPRSRRSRKAPAEQPELAPESDAAGGQQTPVADQPPAPEPAAEESRKGGRNRRRRGRGGADEESAEGSQPVAPTIVEAAGPDAAGAAPGAGEAVTDSDEQDSGSADLDDTDTDADTAADTAESSESGGRRRRRRGRRGRGRVVESGDEEGAEDDDESAPASDGDRSEDAANTDADGAVAATGDAGPDESADIGEDEGNGRRRRRRRRRGGAEDSAVREDDPDNTVVHVREARSAAAEVQGVRGSTRLEAKRQRRRDSRESRRRPQILTEAEFLARREAVHRVMAVRQRGDLAQVALLEDGVLVEHFVSRAGSASMIGDIFLGRVQNVLPSMEAAFIDIGRGRNAVLYAGEVNWDAAGLAGKARRIETALSSGDMILVQVSKDPVGHKGARLTTQISLPGRFLVYVPGGGATGISRKLPDTERKRLKAILDRIVPEEAGVIIRTAAEGVAEEELAADVERLKAQWEEISGYAERARENKGNGSTGPVQLSSEPDTLIKVVRDLFNSDISSLVIDGEDAYAAVTDYVDSVAPELAGRVSGYRQPDGSRADVFSAYRIDEQIAKALERKVHLPSGGSLVIDRTEAMTVIDVNTGKYTGSGGNLEETVTKNNLEAAEEIVRQLRLRDIGGIIVVDFIDMVLESNRELVLRRLTECLGRDRTRHQVAEVTSLGLVQMTRKKMGTGLVEAFSEQCEHCHGRGIILKEVPVDPAAGEEDAERKGRRRGRGRTAEPVSPPVSAPKPPVAVVRPPDPRGPKPPARVAVAAVAAVDEATVQPPATEPGDISSADLGREASDAVAAVLAALDARLAAQAADQFTVTPDQAPARDEPKELSEPLVESAASIEPAPAGNASELLPADQPAAAADPESDSGSGPAPGSTGEDQAETGTARRRRGRRAAGRPAGAPAADSGAVLVVTEAAPNGGTPAGPVPEADVTDVMSTVVIDEPAPKRRRRVASRPAGPAQGSAT